MFGSSPSSSTGVYDFSSLPAEMKAEVFAAASDEALPHCLLVSKLCRDVILETGSLRKRLFLCFAKSLIGKVEDLKELERVRGFFVDVEIKMRRFGEAKACAQEIRDPSEAFAAWIKIAEGEWKANEREKAELSLNEARRIFENRPARVDQLLKLAEVEMKFGLPEMALQTITLAKAEASTESIGLCVESFSTIALFEAKMGNEEGAQSTFLEAKRKACESDGPIQIEKMFITIALKERELGWFEEAGQTVQDLSIEAKEKFQKEISPQELAPNPIEATSDMRHFYQLKMHAFMLLALKKQDEAEETIEKARILLESHPEDPCYFPMLIDLAESYFQLKHTQEGNAILGKASEHALKQEDYITGLALLKKLIEKEIEMECFEEAKMNVAKAYESMKANGSVESMENKLRKCSLRIAKLLSEKNKEIGAWESDAIADALTLTDPDVQAKTLERVANKQADRGAYEEARVTLGYIADTGKRAELLLNLTRTASRRGMYPEAIRTARAVPTAFHRIQAMLSI